MSIGNTGKEAFGAALNSYGQTPVTDTCHNYGSVSGCDYECPALLRGECQAPDWMVNGYDQDVDADIVDDLIKMYSLEDEK